MEISTTCGMISSREYNFSSSPDPFTCEDNAAFQLVYMKKHLVGPEVGVCTSTLSVQETPLGGSSSRE